MIVDELKDSILESAIRGTLVYNSKDNASELLQKMIEKKEIYLKENKLQNNKTGVSKNKKFILPSNWVWTSIGEVCFVTKLAGFEYTKYMAPNLSSVGDVPIVRARNIKPNCFIDNCEEYISSELSDTLYRCALNEKCTLMTFIGAGIGEVAIFDKDTRYHLAPNVAKIVPSLDINKYLLYYLMSPTGRKNIFQYKKQTAQPSLSMETIRNVILPLPPIEEQQRIVNKIEKLFAKLDEIKPIEQELTELKNNFVSDMRNSILQNAYSGKLCNSDYSNWNEDKCIKLMNIYTGNSISETVKKNKYTGLNDGYNYIATKDLEFNHTFNYDNGIKIPFDETGFKYADKDSILMCIEGGSAGKKIGILDEKVCFGNKLCMFKPITGSINHKFIYYYLQSPLFLKNFNDNMTGIIGGVSINKLKEIKIKYPSIEEQQKIVNKIEELLPLCDDIEKLVSK